ncbi:uncharacterized protein FIBRA_08841 [Fibroporia radiculosa]|uniref:DUF6699 domain-containing protein n=1 Tax=Fibroporia radiculosa TaxID=599839 RepID=J4GXH6_9APHY|nr:uncharacterized protein FIBRA_08841 [Fibroporia radiculosa]CCM06565.1 predicted protein [Fibroporia radiculosa]
MNLDQQQWNSWRNQHFNIPPINNLADPKKVVIHSLLRSKPDYTWDIRDGPHTADPDMVTERLSDQATYPALQSIILTSPLFPWQLPILPRVTPFVSVGDVLHTVHEMAITPLSAADIALLPDEEVVQSELHYQTRCDFLVDPSERRTAKAKGVLRMDVLHGHHYFAGVAIFPNSSRPGQVWELRLR